MKRFVVPNNYILVVLVYLTWIATAASNYRYGTLNWQATGEGSTGRMVTFTINSAWRSSAFSLVLLGGTVNVGTTLRPIALTGPSFSVIHTISVLNLASDWFIGSSEIEYEYSSDGTFLAEVANNCCRSSSLVNNANGDFRLTSQVFVQAMVARQGIVTTTAPIVTVTFNQLNIFQIPTLSPDDPFIRFYIATADQAAGVGQSFTPINELTIDSETGVVSWFAGTIGLHCTHFIIEGYATQADADARLNILGSTSVDFIIDSRNPIGNIPEFSQISHAGVIIMFSPMSNDSIVITLQQGEDLDLTVFATDIDILDTVTLTPTTIPSGSAQVSTPGNPGSFNVMWTPPMGSMGAIICFTASDNNGNTAPGQLCVEVQIEEEIVGNIPEFSQITQAGVNITFSPMSNDSVVITLQQGEDLDLTVFATDIDILDSVTLTLITIPSGSAQVSTPGNPGSFNVMWAPPMGSMGAIICFTASDNNGNTAPGQLCVEVQIEEEIVGNIPEFSQITQAGVNIMFSPMSNDSVVITLQQGENLDLTVFATDIDILDTVTLTPATLPSGSAQVSTPGNPGSFNVMWTPPMGSMGAIICFTASDNNGNTTPSQLCVEVQVGGGAVGDPHITSFWGCHIDAPKSEERALLMDCANGDSLSVSYYEEFDYRIRIVWTVINGKKEHYKWNALRNSQKRTICGNEIEFHRYHTGINVAVKSIRNRNIGGMFNDTSCYDDKSKAVFAHSGKSY